MMPVQPGTATNPNVILPASGSDDMDHDEMNADESGG